MDVKHKQLGMMQQQSKGTMKKIVEVMETGRMTIKKAAAVGKEDSFEVAVVRCTELVVVVAEVD